MSLKRASFVGGAIAILALLLALGLGLRSSERASANPVTGFTEIDGGLFHSCGLMTSGAVKCWGTAIDRNFGPGYVDFGRTPVTVGGWTSGLTDVTTGLYHVCAVTTSGDVQCLGRQYGSYPTTVSAFGSGVVSISAGWDYTCALNSTGGIACFFTDGTPLATTGLTSGITQVAAANGFHTCVLMTNTTVKCWGFNEHGQIGDGTTVPRPTAVTVTGLSNVTQISLGTFYSCALTTMGGVKCWGDGFGPTPVDLPGFTNGIAEISASVEHFCARTTTGGVKCRGNDPYGQLGDNFECGTTCLTPVVPAGLSSGVAHINTGHEHSCAILSNGQARCWGFNGLGSVGDGSHAVKRPVPVVVAQSGQKPVPTATLCPGVCPTATPVPTLAPSELNFGLGIDSDGDFVDNCRTFGTFLTSTCNVQIGSQFSINVYLTGLPNGVPSYVAFAGSMTFTGVQSKDSWTFVWPDCFISVRHEKPGYTNGACANVAFSGLESSYTGLMARAVFTCGQAGTVSLAHGVADTALVGRNRVGYFEPPAHVDQLTVNCVNLPPATPTPTSTPTPNAVGGIAIESGDGQDGPAGWWWAIVAGLTVAIVGGAAYVARRLAADP